MPDGVEVHRIESDLGPATKVLPAVREFTGKDVDILFCDDDVAYDQNWTQRFAKLREMMPRACLVESGKDIKGIAARNPQRLPRLQRKPRTLLRHILRKSSYEASGYCDILMGVGGVMVRPDFFTEAAFDIPSVLWAVDDIWLSGQLEMNSIPIWLNAEAPRRRERQNKRIAPLAKTVNDDHQRDEANRAGIAYFQETYGIWANWPANS